MTDLLTRTRTMLTADWLPSQPRLADPSSDDPTTRSEAAALLRRLPHRQQVLCAYLAARDVSASDKISTACSEALALVRCRLAGEQIRPEDLRSASAAAAAVGVSRPAWVGWAAEAASWTAWLASEDAGYNTEWAAAEAAAWAAWAAAEEATGDHPGEAAYLPLWWRRCRATLAFRDVATAEIVWDTE